MPVMHSQDDPRKDECRNTIYPLFQGSLAIVDDEAYENTFVQYIGMIERHAYKDALLAKSIELGRACRVSIRESWNVDLEHIKSGMLVNSCTQSKLDMCTCRSQLRPRSAEPLHQFLYDD